MDVSHGHSSTTPPELIETTPLAPPTIEEGTAATKLSHDDQPPVEKKPKIKKEKPRPSSSKLKKTVTSVTQQTVSRKDYSTRNGYESRRAYRKMFTSSAPARDKDKTPHWVTFFPYH